MRDTSEEQGRTLQVQGSLSEVNKMVRPELRVINGGKSPKKTDAVDWKEPPLTLKQLLSFSEMRTTRQIAAYFRSQKIKHMPSVLVWYEDRGIIACRRLTPRKEHHDNSTIDAWGWYLTGFARRVLESIK